MIRFIVSFAALLSFAGAIHAQGTNTNRTDLVPSFSTSTPPASLTAMNITQSMTINTDVTPMPLEVLSLTIQSGVVVRVVGTQPFYVKAELDIFIFGVLDGSGFSFLGFGGGPGGFAGGGINQPGQGPNPGLPGTAQGGGGGGGNDTSGLGGTGPGGGAGGLMAVAQPLQSQLRAGSGGGGTDLTVGGGGGGIMRLHAKGRIFINGCVLANGARGGDMDISGFQAWAGAGGGAGGTVELVSSLVQVSGGSVSVAGGMGGIGVLQDGGAGGDGLIIVRSRSNQITGPSTFSVLPIIYPYGATMSPDCPAAFISVQPDISDFPAAFGAQAFIVFSSTLLAPGSEIALGGGKQLFLNPSDPLFDPIASPLYPLVSGQGGLIGGTLEATVQIDFGPLVAILASAAFEEFSIFVQAVLIKNGLLFDASEVTTIDYLAVH
ncbi:MAG: hypothetical protein KDB53_10430 [Planctomycetes bacterium]|nr:hypothetical protein [Planctomycetota bacterium]